MKISLPIIALYILSTPYSIEARRNISKRSLQPHSSKINTKSDPLIDVAKSNPNRIRITNQKDVISFLGNRDAEHKFKGYNGLANARQLKTLLNDQNYIEVLKYLWTEKDQAKRIQWLTTEAENGHVICMYELSKELAKTNNYTECTMWYVTAKIRAQQDIGCCTDASVQAALDCLIMHYAGWGLLPCIEKCISCISDNSDMLKTDLEIDSSAIAKAKSFKNYPSPQWMSHHGLHSFMSDIYPHALKPQNEWVIIRKKRIEQSETRVNELRKIDPKSYPYNKILELLRKKDRSVLDKLRVSIKTFLQIEHPLLLTQKVNELKKTDPLLAETWLEILSCLS